jgi:hypothetical protein
MMMEKVFSGHKTRRKATDGWDWGGVFAFKVKN